MKPRLDTSLRIGKRENKVQKMWEALFDPNVISDYKFAKECFILGLTFKYAAKNEDVNGIVSLIGHSSKGDGQSVTKNTRMGLIDDPRFGEQRKRTMKLRREGEKEAGISFKDELQAAMKKQKEERETED